MEQFRCPRRVRPPFGRVRPTSSSRARRSNESTAACRAAIDSYANGKAWAPPWASVDQPQNHARCRGPSTFATTLRCRVLIVDEAQETLTQVLIELGVLASEDLDSRQPLCVVLAGDRRLTERLRGPELMPVGSHAAGGRRDVVALALRGPASGRAPQHARVVRSQRGSARTYDARVVRSRRGSARTYSQPRSGLWTVSTRPARSTPVRALARTRVLRGASARIWTIGGDRGMQPS